MVIVRARAAESTATRRDSEARSTPRLLQIEGLRAVAAILVAIFHIWLGRVSGGVDVFFVISGYLITTTLFGHFGKYGRPRPGIFLGRLVRRLFPAAMVVLLAVFVGALVLFSGSAQLQTFREIVGSALYIENWQLGFSAVDYLETGAFHTPVQHFWAMSAQGQFYLIWLIVFLVVWRLGPHHRRTAVIIISSVVAASLTYSVVTTAIDQPFAYYDSLARVWEFGIGGLVALVGHRIRLSTRVRAVFAGAGLLGVLSCGFLFQASSVFPGYAALWPVTASVLVLLGGVNGAGKFLASRPMVWLGSIAFGIYLWHWPILIFWVHKNLGEYPDIPSGLAIIAASIGLACATKYLLEAKLRTARNTRALTAVLLVLAVLTAGAATGATRMTDHKIQKSIAAARALASGSTPCVGAATMADPGGCASVIFTEALSGDPYEDVSDGFSPRCTTRSTGSEIRECSYGQLNSERRMVLLGNSHAMNWFPALEQYALAEGWRLDVFFKEVCAFNQTLRQTSDPRVGETCVEWVGKVGDILESREVYDAAITGYSASGAALGASAEEGIRGFVDALSPLSARGTALIVMADTPRLPEPAYQCYMGNLGDVGVCPQLTPEEVSPGRDLLVDAAAEIPGAAVVDLNWLFCMGTCPTQVGGVNVYRDMTHLTATWALTTTPYLSEELNLRLPTLQAP